MFLVVQVGSCVMKVHQQDESRENKKNRKKTKLGMKCGDHVGVLLHRERLESGCERWGQHVLSSLGLRSRSLVSVLGLFLHLHLCLGSLVLVLSLYLSVKSFSMRPLPTKSTFGRDDERDLVSDDSVWERGGSRTRL